MQRSQNIAGHVAQKQPQIFTDGLPSLFEPTANGKLPKAL
jgi:hypothetical protein